MMVVEVVLVTLLFVAGSCPEVRAANWAQTNGVKKQQTALVTGSPFTARYGHACVVVDSGPSAFDYVEEAENVGFTGNSVDRLICIGGDDYNEVTGGGGLRNDVWETSGIDWRIATAETILNEYDNPRITTVSDMKWNQLSKLRYPPEVPYLSWLACSIYNLGMNLPDGITCGFEPEEWQFKIFSPRRHHAAVTFRAAGDATSRIYVMGGRSRVLVDYPDGWERVHGGFTERLEGRDEEYSLLPHWREENALMNDIWVSPGVDSAAVLPGTDWALVNPGCITRYYPHTLPAEEQLWSNGSAAARCQSQADCAGDSTCDTFRSVCICNIWSPREQHAVAVYKNKIYLTGGFVWLDQHVCAGRACGGGYRSPINDVWWTTDAFAWLTIGYGTMEAEWSPRAGHQLIVPFYSELYSLNLATEDGLMYMVGGQTFDMKANNTREFLGDVWVTSDGAKWTKVRDSSDDNTFPARSHHVAAMIDDVMVISSGYNADGQLDDTWTWDRTADSTTNDRFVKDFSETTDFTDYVDDSSPVSVIPMINDVNEAKLNSLDIYTVTDLAEIESWKVKQLQDFYGLDYPDICLHIKWAESILDNCIAVIEPLDYVEWDGAFERKDDWDAKLKVNQTKSQAQITEETDFCESMFLEWTGSWTNYLLFNQEQPYPFPLKCKSLVGPLAMPTGAVYQDRFWLIGGLVDQSAQASKTSNVWYREPHIPSTSFVVKPETQTSDQVFEFACSDTYSSWCRYQYRILDMSERPPIEVRHWSDTAYLLDYGAYWSGGWLPRGDYMLQVRAIGPSGNKESSFQEGRNQHTWTHIPEPPWDIIITILVAVLLIVVGVIVFERYKARKAALQRYAMKRMRRKFKRMQKIKAGKLHKDRADRAQEAKADAVVKEAKRNKEEEVKVVANKRSKRRRRKGPAVTNSASVAASL